MYAFYKDQYVCMLIKTVCKYHIGLSIQTLSNSICIIKTNNNKRF